MPQPDKKYEVGQEVWLYETWRRGAEPQRVKVIKVGRTLVTTEGPYGRDQQFRMDTGYLNDRQYAHHAYIRTDEERALAQRRAAPEGWLAEHRLHDLARLSKVPTDVLERIVELLKPHVS